MGVFYAQGLRRWMLSDDFPDHGYVPKNFVESGWYVWFLHAFGILCALLFFLFGWLLVFETQIKLF